MSLACPQGRLSLSFRKVVIYCVEWLCEQYSKHCCGVVKGYAWRIRPLSSTSITARKKRASLLQHLYPSVQGYRCCCSNIVFQRSVCCAGTRQLLDAPMASAPAGQGMAPGPAPMEPMADILFIVTSPHAMLTANALVLTSVAKVVTYYTNEGQAGLYTGEPWASCGKL